MNRYMAKLNADHLPGPNPTAWEDQLIHIPRFGARRVDTTQRAPSSEIIIGDEVWVCTDATGPGGIAAKAKVSEIHVLAQGLAFRIKEVEVIPRPVSLSEFGRLQSGSLLITQLQRNRHPDLYIIEEETFEQFQKVIRETLGPESLPPQIDWDEIVTRNRSAAHEQFAILRDVPLALRPVREGQRAFRECLMRLYNGRCVATGCSIAIALEAAHIIPWTGDPYLDRPENGLILRRDVHALFDAGLLGLEPYSNQIIISGSLRESDYASLSGCEVKHQAEPRLVAERFEQFTASFHQ